MRVDYIIFYEHASRELEADMRLKEDLDSLGLKGVILPIHFNRYINALKFSPKLIILPFLYKYEDSHFAKTFKKLDPSLIIANLHSEQIGTVNSQTRMMPLDEESKHSIHFVWGNHFKELLINKGVPEELIYAYGSIRNDLIFKYKKVTPDEKYILVPTSFSMTFVDEDYIESAIKKRNIDRSIFMKGLEFRFESRDKFFKIINDLAIELADNKFVLRPHPYVDINDYKEKFCEVNEIEDLPKNIKIERDGSIARAMSKCSHVIVWHSTSVLEAQIMGKKIFQLAPIEFPSYDYMEYMEFVPRGKTAEECLTFINQNNLKQERLNEYLKKVYGPLDGNATKRVAKKVAELINNHKIQQAGVSNDKVKCISYLILKSLAVDFPKNLLRKMNLLHKIIPSYKGIMEDYQEVK